MKPPSNAGIPLSIPYTPYTIPYIAQFSVYLACQPGLTDLAGLPCGTSGAGLDFSVRLLIVRFLTASTLFQGKRLLPRAIILTVILV